jgi:hypothetical protein
MQNFISFFITIIFILLGIFSCYSAFGDARISYKENKPFIKKFIFYTIIGLSFILIGLLNYLQIINLSNFLKKISDCP